MTVTFAPIIMVDGLVLTDCYEECTVLYITLESTASREDSRSLCAMASIEAFLDAAKIDLHGSLSHQLTEIKIREYC